MKSEGTSEGLPQSSPRALKWYRRLVNLVLIWSLLATAFTLLTLFLKVDQAYGGFLWSWDSSHGYYRVDNFSLPEEMGPLQPADHIISVEGGAYGRSENYHRAHDFYRDYDSVCKTGQDEQPTVQYTIQRDGTHILNLDVEVRCFRIETLIRLITLPLALGAVIWTSGFIVYRANPDEELNLVFAFMASGAATMLITQAAAMPPIDSAQGQFVSVFIVNFPMLMIVISLAHITAIFPDQHLSVVLYRTRALWYFIIPLFLLAVGALRFLLGGQWSTYVQILDRVAGWGTGLFLGAVLVVFALRCIHIFRTTKHQRAKTIVKSLVMLIFFSLVYLLILIAQQEPQIAALNWLPVGETLLLYWPPIIFLWIGYLILRYQVFPSRTWALRLPVALFVGNFITVVSAPLVFISAQIGLGALLIIFSIVNIIWSQPNPIQRLLLRLGSAGSIEPDVLKHFNNDIEQLNEDRSRMHQVDALTQTIVDSLEKHLELNFAALWMSTEEELDDGGISQISQSFTLMTYTEKAPGPMLPLELSDEWITSSDPFYVEGNLLEEAGFRIMLPLFADERTFGVIGLSRRWTEEPFDYEDLKTFKLFANQSALAIRTAKQFHEMRVLSQRLLRAQEDVSKQIARDMHSTTVADLESLGREFESRSSRASVSEEAVIYGSYVKRVREITTQLRIVMGQLEKGRLFGGENFVSELEKLCERSRRPGFSIQLYARPEINLILTNYAKHEKALFGVCQDALNNVLKHAPKAKQVQMTFQLGPDMGSVEFSIIDDGPGFIPRPDLPQKHKGLKNMRERIEELNGNLKIESTPGKGTVVKGYLPIHN